MTSRGTGAIRRWLWRIIIAILLAASLGITAAAGVARYGPFDPGDGLFYRGQRRLEELLVSFRSPTEQARQRIQLATHRLSSMQRLAGGEYEGDAFYELEQALREAVRAASICPQSDAGEIRPELEALFENTAKTLDRIEPLGTPKAVDAAAFRTWLAEMTQRLRQPDLRLAELGLTKTEPASAVQGKEEGTDQASVDPTAAPAPVDPRAVYFPPGSSGAEHQFYPLVGRHGETSCTSCHAKGEYAGTPNVCETCHAQQKPAEHFPGQCELCHAPTAWDDVHFEHVSPASDDCQACHAQPEGHYPGTCAACHSTQAWTPASFDHTGAGASDCLACHASDTPANHYDGQCSLCHNPSGWTPANFNHTFSITHGGANGQCSACHPSGTSSWTCFTCHDQSEMDKKHDEVGIPNYASRCLECHADGKNGDD